MRRDALSDARARGRTQPSSISDAGRGLSGIALADAGFTTIDGCDLSPGMLAKAEEMGLYRRLFRGRSQSAAARRARRGPTTRQHVSACSHTDMLGRDALDDIVRVVKPGGCLVVGLNDHFYRQGALMAKLDAMESDRLLADRTDTHGEHIIGTGLDRLGHQKRARPWG